MKRLLLALVFVVVALAGGGAGYEHVNRWLDARSAPDIGRRFDVGGRQLNIACEGTGSPTIIYESGKQIPGFFWQAISHRTATFARSCWYDRAGMGWSDDAPVPHTGRAIARDLHALLGAADIKPPYILVAHSLGAFYSRVYNGMFAHDVAGLVLVDPASEDVATRMASTPRRGPPLGLSQRALARVAGTLGFFGLTRLFSHPSTPKPSAWSDADWRTLTTLERRPQSIVANIAEGPYQTLGEEARAAGGFGATPLIVISAGHDALPPDALKEKLVIHQELAHRSTRGRTMLLEQSGHFVPFEYPDSVVAAVRALVDSARMRP